MKSFFIVEPEVKDFIKKNFDKENTEAIEKVIQYLKQKGFSQLQSVFILVEEGQLPFQKANSFVLNSKAWS